MLYLQFKPNTTREREGIFLEYGFLKTPDGEADESRPVRIKIARAGGANTAFTKRLDARIKPYRRQLQTETMDNGIAQKLMREVFAETVVLGWENVQDENGNDLEFNVPNCIKIFTDLPDWFADVQLQAQNGALFRADLRAADSGN